jgi:hypothetical protein
MIIVVQMINMRKMDPKLAKKMQMDLVTRVSGMETESVEDHADIGGKRKRSPMLPEHCRDASESEYGMRRDGFVEGGVEQEVAFKEGRLRVD